MPIIEKTKRKSRRHRRTGMTHMLGIAVDDAVKTVHQIRAGFSYKVLARFQKTTKLPWTEISRFVAIPQRTLSRRQGRGRLSPDESDRVLRASRIFDMAAELFEGDTAAARTWLETPQRGLGGETPLDFASTEVGAREVENLIGRLEHGVFA